MRDGWKKYGAPPREGTHRRFFWRIRHRLSANWWLMSPSQCRRELRMVSWRRP